MLNLNCAIGSIKLLCSGAANDNLDSLGVSHKDYEITTSNTHWVGSQRTTVVKCLDSILFGSLDIIGIPRFAAPAEYIAAVICLIVSPTNLLVACRWMEDGHRIDEIATDSGESAGSRSHVSAEKLFALCIKLHNNCDVESFKHMFNKSCGLASAITNPEPKSKQKNTLISS